MWYELGLHVILSAMSLIGGTPDTTCLVMPYTNAYLTASGYGGGAWAADGGDGPIFGYASHEDTTIWNRPECVTSGD